MHVTKKLTFMNIEKISFLANSFRRPKAPAFLFLSPLESTWENLQSIIPNMLQLSVVGYPFVNPGAVGGVGHFKNR